MPGDPQGVAVPVHNRPGENRPPLVRPDHCSDVDLLAWVEAGGTLSYLEPGQGSDGTVRDAFASLAALHAARTERSSAATIGSG